MPRSDSTQPNRPRWITLIMAYLLVVGAGGSLRVVVELARGSVAGLDFEHQIVPYDASGDQSSWEPAAYEVWRGLTPVVVLACGLSLWRWPERARLILALVLAAYSIDVVLFGLVELHQASSWLWRIHAAICVVVAQRYLVVLALLGVAVCAKALRCPERTLLALYLLIVGCLSAARFSRVAKPTPGRIFSSVRIHALLGGWWSGVSAALAAVGAWIVVLSGLVMIGCGLLIGLRRTWQGTPWLLIGAGASLVAVRMAGFAVYAAVYQWNAGHNGVLEIMTRSLEDAAILVGIGVFILRFRLTDGEADHRCAKCGYNLTGNVTGICPECGAPLPGQAAEALSGEHVA